jgi:hypothetical protein
MAKCPHTALTIPECSCSTCLEDQVRRAAPALLEREPQGPLAAEPPAVLPAARKAA